MSKDHVATLREKRDLPPGHYTVEIKSYTKLFKSEAKLERYVSGVFEAGRYKWRLNFYPNGKKEDGGDGHISLYLAIDKSNNFSDNWRVHVTFKLLVQDQNRNKFYTVQGPVKPFDKTRTEWGFSQFLSLESFNEPSNGYLLNDRCVFGAEVYVVQPTGHVETLSIVKNPVGGTHAWSISKFSKLDETAQFSRAFIVGDREWKLKLYPVGTNSGKGNSLSVFLLLTDMKSLPPKRPVFAEYKLRLVDQLRHVNHSERKYEHWFTADDTSYGAIKFISLEDLYKVSKGFVKDDTLKVEVQFLCISVAN